MNLKDTSHVNARRALLVDPAPGQRKALLEILTCDNCRTVMTATLLMHPEVGQAALQRLDEEPGRQPGPAEVRNLQQAAAAQDFLDAILAAPREARSSFLEGERWRSVHFVVAALMRARRTAPGEALYLVRLALDWSDLNPAGLEEAELEEIRGEAEVIAGNAQRRLGRFDDARKSFDLASRRLLGTQITAELCQWEGLLWWELGHFDRAEALLRQSTRLLGTFGVPVVLGVAWTLLGLLLSEKEDSGRSLPLLQAGRECLSPEHWPWLAVQARLAMAWEMVCIRAFDRARGVLAQDLSAAEQALVEDPRVQRLEGRVRSGLGERERGERLLETARVRLLADREVAHAALCTLDLIAFVAIQQRAAELEDLVADFAARFPDESAVLDCLRDLAQSFLDLVEGEKLRLPALAGSSPLSGGWSALSASDLLSAFEPRLRRVLRSAGHRLLLPAQV